MSFRSLLASIILLVAAVLIGFSLKTRSHIPPHLLGHPALAVPELLSQKTAKSLMQLAKQMKEFPTNVEDTKVNYFYN